jgi:hypothetical protein
VGYEFVVCASGPALSNENRLYNTCSHRGPEIQRASGFGTLKKGQVNLNCERTAKIALATSSTEPRPPSTPRLPAVLGALHSEPSQFSPILPDKDWAPSQSPQRRPAVPQGKAQLWTSWGRGKADTLHVRLAFCTSTARSAGTGYSGQQQKFESSIQRVWSGSWDG